MQTLLSGSLPSLNPRRLIDMPLTLITCGEPHIPTTRARAVPSKTPLSPVHVRAKVRAHTHTHTHTHPTHTHTHTPHTQTLMRFTAFVIVQLVLVLGSRRPATRVKSCPGSPRGPDHTPKKVKNESLQSKTNDFYSQSLPCFWVSLGGRPGPL